MSIDPAKLSEASDVVAWYDVSRSMADRGVADMTSIISKDEEDKASLWRKKSKTAGEVFRLVARRRSQSSHSGAKEREGEGWNEV
jgi:hypothetical protein